MRAQRGRGKSGRGATPNGDDAAPLSGGGRGSRGSGLRSGQAGSEGHHGQGTRTGGYRGESRPVGRGGFRSGRGGFGVDAPAYIPDPTPATGGSGPKIAPGVVTVGVRRPEAPIPLTVTTNHFNITIPEIMFYHYDGSCIFSSSSATLICLRRYSLDVVGKDFGSSKSA
jgi:hypothetical protein